MRRYFSTFKALITLTLVASTWSCKNNPLDIDVSNIKIDLGIERFDIDLFNYKTHITQNNVSQLYDQYNLFFQDFTERVINIGSPKDPSINNRLSSFINDKYIQEIKKDVDNSFSNFSSYKSNLEEAFAHYKYYFPQKEIPQIITYISGFNYAIITDDHYLGIGLDMFLGANYEAYKQLGLPQYKTSFMNKESLVASAMLGWISTEFELHEKNANLLSEMIHQGKILYLLDALLPSAPNSIKISYTKDQLKWCNENEKQAWFYFIDNDLLYTKKTTDIIKYMGEAPFIQGFPEGSPGRIGHWVGWQIIKSYMKNNPDTTLEKLMQLNNAQQILNSSNYKP